MRPAALLAAACLAAAPSLARAGEPTPVVLGVGKALNLCSAGLAFCPVTSFMCDDPKIALIENGPAGAELKGIAPGTTICSLLGPGRAFPRVFRVTVKRPGRPGAGAPAP